MNRIIRGTVLILALSFGSNVSALESPLPVGYFCNPDSASIVDGQHYLPQSDPCTYLSSALSFGPRAGVLYRGTVGSSTTITGHSIGAFGATSTESGDVPSANLQGVQQGEDMFVAIYRIFASFQGPLFDAYFKTGAGTPPHNDYGFIRFEWGTPPPLEPDEPDPVISIPGILGSEKNSAGEWIIDPILHTYDDLIATLDANHYTPDVDLFTFPYNWRKSNVETAVLLKEKIDAVKAICQCEKVDLVAHSMGGLVARQYIQSDAYQQDVDQLIFLGTPHLGAPKAYLMWEGGTVGAPPLSFFDSVFRKILEHEGYEKRYPSLFAYLRTEPIESVRQLLSVENYIFDGSTFRSYPDKYPMNAFLSALNDNVDKLYSSGVEIYNFVGKTHVISTMTGLKVIETDEYAPLWEHGYPEGFYDNSGSPGLIRGDGDATVPISSAKFVIANITETPFEHNALPVETEGDVFQLLTGKIAGSLVRDKKFPNIKIILIKMLSPADLLVIAPDGKKIGKERGIEVNEIQDAFYTGFNTETEFITILNPLDGEYKVYTEGTNAGTYTVEADYISEATTTGAVYTGNTSLGLVTELTLKVNNENPQALEIMPPDTTPPTITIVSPEIKDYLRSDQLLVDVVAEDGNSGVVSLETRLDAEVIPDVGSVDLFYESLGYHFIFVSSTDNAGNVATSSRTFRVISNATSTLSDIERAYTLGWITKKIKDSLVKKLNSCNVKRTSVTTVTKTVVVTGNNGKPTTKKIQEKVTKVEIVFDKNCAKAMLKDLDKHRNKGLNEQAYQLLREDVEWLIEK